MSKMFFSLVNIIENYIIEYTTEQFLTNLTPIFKTKQRYSIIILLDFHLFQVDLL
jgi:hypothetical protein